MIVLAILMLLFSLAVPSLLQSVKFAQEAKAVETLRQIQTAQEAYRILHGSYAGNFRELGQRASPEGNWEAEFGSGPGGQAIMVFQGYIYRLQPLSRRSYRVSAEPIVGRHRMTWFTMDEFGEIRPPDKVWAPGMGAPAEPQEKSPLE
jgi:type II secretory pathway pseudopilin PulG